MYKEYYEKHRDEILEKNRKYYRDNRTKMLLQMKEWRDNNKEKHREKSRMWRKNNPEKVKQGNIRNRESIRLWSKKELKRLKYEVIKKYSKNKIECMCCGEDVYDFLTIEHIKNDGNEDSKKFKSSRKWYKHLIEKNLYDRITIACWNCNCGRNIREDKKCPHEVK